MVFERYSQQLTARVAMLFVTLAALAYAVIDTRFVFTPLVLLAAVVVQLALLLRAVRRTNQELVRFLDAARHADFSQRFAMPGLGGHFDELGETFEALVQRFCAVRTAQAQQLRYLEALLEQVPIAVIALRADDRIDMMNHAARRLFGPLRVARLEDLVPLGDGVCEALRSQPPGERRIVEMRRGDQAERTAVAVSELTLDGETQRLISLESIQSTLESTEQDAWRTLVRVLTHEIMNSATPIASLANTAVELIDRLPPAASDDTAKADTLRDVRTAVGTVAARTEGLLSFIHAYRALSRVPDPVCEPLRVARLLEELARLEGPELEARGIRLEVTVEPAELELMADRRLLEQALINLIANAGDALHGRAEPLIRLDGGLAAPAGRAVLRVVDNGPGIPLALRQEVFVPFFTTRASGSGVGLPLVRQIMQAHGGSVALICPEHGGTMVELRF